MESFVGVSGRGLKRVDGQLLARKEDPAVESASVEVSVNNYGYVVKVEGKTFLAVSGRKMLVDRRHLTALETFLKFLEKMPDRDRAVLTVIERRLLRNAPTMLAWLNEQDLRLVAGNVYKVTQSEAVVLNEHQDRLHRRDTWLRHHAGSRLPIFKLGRLKIRNRDTSVNVLAFRNIVKRLYTGQKDMYEKQSLRVSEEQDDEILPPANYAALYDDLVVKKPTPEAFMQLINEAMELGPGFAVTMSIGNEYKELYSLFLDRIQDMTPIQMKRQRKVLLKVFEKEAERFRSAPVLASTQIAWRDDEFDDDFFAGLPQNVTKNRPGMPPRETQLGSAQGEITGLDDICLECFEAENGINYDASIVLVKQYYADVFFNPGVLIDEGPLEVFHLHSTCCSYCSPVIFHLPRDDFEMLLMRWYVESGTCACWSNCSCPRFMGACMGPRSTRLASSHGSITESDDHSPVVNFVVFAVCVKIATWLLSVVDSQLGSSHGEMTEEDDMSSQPPPPAACAGEGDALAAGPVGRVVVVASGSTYAQAARKAPPPKPKKGGKHAANFSKHQAGAVAKECSDSAENAAAAEAARMKKEDDEKKAQEEKEKKALIRRGVTFAQPTWTGYFCHDITSDEAGLILKNHLANKTDPTSLYRYGNDPVRLQAQNNRAFPGALPWHSEILGKMLRWQQDTLCRYSTHGYKYQIYFLAATNVIRLFIALGQKLPTLSWRVIDSLFSLAGAGGWGFCKAALQSFCKCVFQYLDWHAATRRQRIFMLIRSFWVLAQFVGIGYLIGRLQLNGTYHNVPPVEEFPLTRMQSDLVGAVTYHAGLPTNMLAYWLLRTFAPSKSWTHQCQLRFDFRIQLVGNNAQFADIRNPLNRGLQLEADPVFADVTYWATLYDGFRQVEVYRNQIPRVDLVRLLYANTTSSRNRLENMVMTELRAATVRSVNQAPEDLWDSRAPGLVVWHVMSDREKSVPPLNQRGE